MLDSKFKSITSWQNETFPNSDGLSKVNHLIQEVKELKEELIKHKTNPNLKTIAGIKEEIADCFILLFGVASASQLDYVEIAIAIEKKMEINKSRKWGKADENGVVNHIA